MLSEGLKVDLTLFPGQCLDWFEWKKIREGSLTFIYLVCYSDLPFYAQYYP